MYAGSTWPWMIAALALALALLPALGAPAEPDPQRRAQAGQTPAAPDPAARQPGGHTREEHPMATLHVDIQDGFFDDEVRVLVDGAEVFMAPGVRTRFQIGLAESFAVTVEPGPVEVTVELPRKGLSASLSVAVDGDLYVGVSLGEDNRLIMQQSDTPFRYM
jgi:hypothetical protein